MNVISYAFCIIILGFICYYIAIVCLSMIMGLMHLVLYGLKLIYDFIGLFRRKEHESI